jgi:hypothetical protein
VGKIEHFPNTRGPLRGVQIEDEKECGDGGSKHGKGEQQFTTRHTCLSVSRKVSEERPTAIAIAIASGERKKRHRPCVVVRESGAPAVGSGSGSACPAMSVRIYLGLLFLFFFTTAWAF